VVQDLRFGSELDVVSFFENLQDHSELATLVTMIPCRMDERLPSGVRHSKRKEIRT